MYKSYYHEIHLFNVYSFIFNDNLCFLSFLIYKERFIGLTESLDIIRGIKKNVYTFLSKF